MHASCPAAPGWAAAVDVDVAGRRTVSDDGWAAVVDVEVACRRTVSDDGWAAVVDVGRRWGRTGFAGGLGFVRDGVGWFVACCAVRAVPVEPVAGVDLA